MRKALSLVIREIKSNRYIIVKYINLDIYVLDYYDIDDKLVKVLFKYITFMVNNLKIKMLIGINILTFEDINLNISKRINRINNYCISFNFNVISSIKPFVK